MIELAGVPIIETERLVLRGPKAADADAYVAFMMSERSRYVGGPRNRARSWRTWTIEVGHWLYRGYGPWVVTLKGDDTGLGMVGPWYPEGWPEHEMSWILWEAAEGRGIAYEAALASRAWAFEHLGWTTAVSYIDRPNRRSIELAARLGAARDRSAATPDDEDCLVYRHPGPEALG